MYSYDVKSLPDIGCAAARIFLKTSAMQNKNAWKDVSVVRHLISGEVVEYYYKFLLYSDLYGYKQIKRHT